MKKSLQQAAVFHQAGEIQAAKAIYLRILDEDPDNAEALHLLGVAAYQTGAANTAIELIAKAINHDNTIAAYHHNLANAFLQVGRVGEATAHYQRAIDLQPDYAEAHFGLGNARYQAGDRHMAIAAYNAAVKWTPQMAEAYNNLGIVLGEIGQNRQALVAFKHAIDINPAYIEAHCNLGHTLKNANAHAEAVVAYRRLLQCDPELHEIHAALGDALHALGKLNQAVASYRRALSIKSDFAAALNDLGTVYIDLNQYDAARRCFERAAALNPKDAAACNNLGVVYKSLMKYDEAARWYRQAIRLNPDFAEAFTNLGHVLGRQKLVREAVSCYRRAISIRPDYIQAHAYLVRQLQHGCMWQELAMAVQRLRQLADAQIAGGTNTGLMPFLAFSISTDPRYNLSVARSWCQHAFAGIRPVSASNPADTAVKPEALTIRRPDNRICIGYLSSDFKNHATAHLIGSLFKTHDRSRFRIHAYSYGTDDGSAYRAQLQADCDQFVDLRSMSHGDAAARIMADSVDILVDLKGHTEGNRMEICAYRPAPIQVAYLGFPGSSGADFMDYLISDGVVTPPDHEAYFSEKLVLLPHTYQVNDRFQKIAATPESRKSAGLPDETFVFCCFNESYKIEARLFDVWMSILRQVSDSVLWLLDTSADTSENLRRQAEKRGVASERLVFAPKIPKQHHLARLRFANLCLDTWMVNGHTTTSDALWAGIPVVVIFGTHFASRVSASLLSAVGLPDLIADSPASYEAMAVRLATHAEELRKLKKRLKDNQLRMPLFDTHRFTRNLESAYQRMWARHVSGGTPKMMQIWDVMSSL